MRPSNYIFSSLLFLSPFIFASSYQDYDTWGFSVLILYVFHIFLVHPICTISYFWNTHRDLSVAEMLKFRCEVFSFLKRYVWNVFVYFHYPIFFSFTAVRIKYCFVTHEAYREHSSSAYKKLIFSYMISLQKKHKIISMTFLNRIKINFAKFENPWYSFAAIATYG